jgi:hypothetical protein
MNICVCGHKKIDHIYEEGACRPGFICSCPRFHEVSFRGISGQNFVGMMKSLHKVFAIVSLVRKRSRVRFPSWAPRFQTLSLKLLKNALEKVVESSLGRFNLLGANSGQSLSNNSLKIVRDFRRLGSPKAIPLSQNISQKTSAVGGLHIKRGRSRGSNT